MSKYENMEMVQGIVEDLEVYASGDYFLHNGELFPIDIWDFSSKVDCEIRKEDTLCGEYTYYIMPDGEEILEDDVEPASLFDYFNDMLDIDYVVDREKHFKGVRIMVTCGGPNIFIDSYRGIVELFWWTEHASAEIPADLCDEINDIFRDYYYC